MPRWGHSSISGDACVLAMHATPDVLSRLCFPLINSSATSANNCQLSIYTCTFHIELAVQYKKRKQWMCLCYVEKTTTLFEPQCNSQRRHAGSGMQCLRLGAFETFSSDPHETHVCCDIYTLTLLGQKKKSAACLLDAWSPPRPPCRLCAPSLKLGL